MEIGLKTLSPDFWDSPPIASSLETASKGWPHDSDTTIAIAASINDLRCEGFLVGDDLKSGKAPVQKVAYRNLFAHTIRNDLNDILRRRYQSIFGTTAEEHVIEHALEALRPLKKYEVVSVLKTWSNAWCTSPRFHEERRLPCLLGCADALDSLTHYCKCKHIFDIVSRLVDEEPEWSGFQDFAISNPCAKALRCTVGIAHAYHVVKFSRLIETNVVVDSSQISTTYSVNVAASHEAFAHAFVAASYVTGLNCRTSPGAAPNGASPA